MKNTKNNRSFKSTWGLLIAIVIASASAWAATKPAPAKPVAPKVVAQTKCPVMGGKINPKLYTTYEGKKVFFCCPPCKAKFEKAPKTYLSRLPQFAKPKAPAKKAPAPVTPKTPAAKKRTGGCGGCGGCGS